MPIFLSFLCFLHLQRVPPDRSSNYRPTSMVVFLNTIKLHHRIKIAGRILGTLCYIFLCICHKRIKVQSFIKWAFLTLLWEKTLDYYGIGQRTDHIWLTQCTCITTYFLYMHICTTSLYSLKGNPMYVHVHRSCTYYTCTF